MSSYGVFEIDLFIKGKKFTHPVNVIEELNENIIGIDFIHAHKLTYDVISRKVMFAGAGTNSIIALWMPSVLALPNKSAISPAQSMVFLWISMASDSSAEIT